MNEQTKKFVEQSAVWTGMIDGWIFDKAKFNELIIQDCIRTLRSNGYDDAAQCLQDIHFGIDHPI